MQTYVIQNLALTAWVCITVLEGELYKKIKFVQQKVVHDYVGKNIVSRDLMVHRGSICYIKTIQVKNEHYIIIFRGCTLLEKLDQY